jgi:hypothetical protein
MVSVHTCSQKVPELRAPEATTSTIMEVPAGLAVAGRLGCADVTFDSDRSNHPLIEDTLAP